MGHQVKTVGTKPLTAMQREVLADLEELHLYRVTDEGYTVEQICETTTLSTAMVRRRIANLLAAGLAEQIGVRRNAKGGTFPKAYKLHPDVVAKWKL